MKNFFLAFTFALLLIPVTYAQDSSPIGTLVGVQGEITIFENGTERSAQSGDTVSLGENVITGPNARALLVMIDDTEITLGENTELEIDEYIYDPENAPKDNEADLSIKGVFLWTSGLVAKDNKNVNIDTDIGSIGIRGTTVWAGPLDDLYQVFVADGAVSYSTNVGRITIRSGQGIAVKSERTAFDLKTWPEAKVDRIMKMISFAEDTDFADTKKSVLDANATTRGSNVDGKETLDETPAETNAEPTPTTPAQDPEKSEDAFGDPIDSAGDLINDLGETEIPDTLDALEAPIEPAPKSEDILQKLDNEKAPEGAPDTTETEEEPTTPIE